MKLTKLAWTVTVALSVTGGLPAAAHADTLKIGVIAALTGGGAPWGAAAAQGPKILASEINAKGGLDVNGKKYKVEVIAYDDQYKAADAVAAYNRLVRQDGVKYVFIMASAGALALKQNVENDKVVALTSSYSAKAVDANSKYMFRMFSVAADYLPSLVEWIKNNYKERRVVTINPNDETGWDHAKLSEKLFKQNGFQILGQELYERTQKDFQPMLTKLIGLKPELIDLGSTPPATAGLIVRQARELGYKGLFSKTGGAGPNEIIAAAGKEAAEGMISILYADRAAEGYKRIASEYRKSVGQEPNEILVSFYDGASVLLNAIQKSGDAQDTTKVAAAFSKALPMPSVQGDMLRLGGKAASGADQQIMSVMYIGVIRNGVPVVVGKAKS